MYYKNVLSCKAITGQNMQRLHFIIKTLLHLIEFNPNFTYATVESKVYHTFHFFLFSFHCRAQG
jgi:hypothetical protein